MPRLVRRRIGPVLAAALVGALASPLRLVSGQALTDSLTTAYELDGLRIIHSRTASRVFAVNLYLLGGTRQITAATAGIEPFVLAASEYGTEDVPGEEARRALARTGSSITVDTDYDWTVFGARGVREELDSTWAVFESRLLRATFDSAAMEIVRRRMLTRILADRNSPDAQVAVLAESLAFFGHPYSLDPNGNDASVRALTADDLRQYVRSQFVKSRMLLVVVGDIPREHLDQLVARAIGKLPRGEYQWSLPDPVVAAKPAVAMAHRSSATNYIFGMIHGPRISDPDYPAFEYAMSLLGSLVSSRIRERDGLSYAANVPVMQRGVSAAAIYVSTTRPDSVVKLVNAIFDMYEDEVYIPRYVLTRASEWFRSNYLLSLETATRHAQMLAEAYLYQGDFRAAARRADVMAKVRFNDMRRIIRTYGKNIQYAYVGDTARAPVKEMLKR